jgi:hypothetical protein
VARVYRRAARVLPSPAHSRGGAGGSRLRVVLGGPADLDPPPDDHHLGDAVHRSRPRSGVSLEVLRPPPGGSGEPARNGVLRWHLVLRGFRQHGTGLPLRRSELERPDAGLTSGHRAGSYLGLVCQPQFLCGHPVRSSSGHHLQRTELVCAGHIRWLHWSGGGGMRTIGLLRGRGRRRERLFPERHVVDPHQR